MTIARSSSCNEHIEELVFKHAISQKTKAGFEAPTYELTTGAYVAILLNLVSLEESLTRLDETVNEILAVLMHVLRSQRTLWKDR
jgi:hypothetical protein